MNMRFPIRVGLMDDDYFALKWNSDLLTHDLRTTVCFEAESPGGLLMELGRCPDIDVLLLDVEYLPEEPPLAALFEATLNARVAPIILCLSQYGSPQALAAALTHGARGFLLKQEVRMEICSALVMALQANFLVTPGILPLINRHFTAYVSQLDVIPPWVPHPDLSKQLRNILTLRVLYGLSAPLTALKIHLATGTVEKYMQNIYQILNTPWGAEEYLAGLELKSLPMETQAFHRFTLPPGELKS